jgi:hypothetical protein
MVWAAAALMAALMAVMAVPATANNLFDDNGNFVGGVLNDGNDLFNDNDIFDHHHRGFFDRNDDDEDLDTIRVGDLECLVEDGDDVDFCVNRHTGEIVNV